MTSKKKLTIAIVSLCILLIVATTSVVLILAAINATVKSGITVRYTAHNVDATVGISYKITGQDSVTMYVDQEKTVSLIEFSPSEDSGVEKAFQPTGEIDIGPTDKIVFTMVVENRHSTDLLYLDTTMLNAGFTALSNMMVDSGVYTSPLADPENEEKYQIGSNAPGFISGSGGVYTVQPSSKIYCYLRFWVVEDTQDALVEGLFPFGLSSYYVSD